MKPTCLRWGFFGAGKCTHDFVTALKLLSPEDHRAVAIASRDLLRAQAFANNLGLERAFGSYSELAETQDIDIVYIGTVNSEHFHQAQLALENGKHVLCEKPICINRIQAEQLIGLAKEKKLFFMEGFWTFFFPATKSLFEEISKGTIGKVVHVSVEIGNKFYHLDRFHRVDIGGGTLLNHGVYGLMFAYRVLGKPSKISAAGIISATGTDENVTVTLEYEDTAQMATIICSCKADMPGELKVIGTEGMLKLCFPFWAPTVLETPTGITKFDLPEDIDASIKFNNLNSYGFTFEAEEVRRCINEDRLESQLVPWEASLSVMGITDEVRKQIGVSFYEDEDNSDPNKRFSENGSSN